jgi:hypothetical protein
MDPRDSRSRPEPHEQRRFHMRRGLSGLATAQITRAIVSPWRSTAESMKLISGLFAVAVSLLGPCLAFAQSPVESLKLSAITVQGSVRTRVYGWDWLEDPPYENSMPTLGRCFA